MPLAEVLDSIAHKMRIDFDEATRQIEHRERRGQAREALIVRTYLDRYLPRTVRTVHGAEVLTSVGQQSGECDIAVVDASTPPLYEAETGYQLLPVECVYGILEVKSRLDGRELRSAAAKIEEIKRYEKSALDDQTGPIVQSTTMYGQEWPFFPIHGVVFAYDSINLVELAQQLWELQGGLEPRYRIDSVYVLSRGCIVSGTRDGLIQLTPQENSVLRVLASDNPLLLMTVQLQTIYSGGWMTRLKLLEYLAGASFGEYLGEIGG